MTTRATEMPKCLIETINRFSFELYSTLNAANANANIVSSPITIFNLFRIIHTCSSDSDLTPVLHLDQNECSENSVSDLLEFKQHSGSSEWNLIAPEQYLQKNHIKHLLNSEKRLKISEDSSRLSEKLTHLNVSLGEEKTQLSVVLDSNLNLDLEWRTEFDPLSDQNLLKSSDGFDDIKLMKIPKSL